MNAHDAAVHKAIQAMINEVGQLRLLVAIDSMPEELQQVRHMLRKLDAEYSKRRAVDSFYKDRANGVHAAKAT